MYELGTHWGREQQLPGTSLQEVTLMKNSVVCSSLCPSGMNKARPRQREKTWAQLETTRWPTAGKHTRWLALGDGPELNFNRASDRLNDISGVSISRCSLCLCRTAPFWTWAKWNTHRLHFLSCRLALRYLNHAVEWRKNCSDAWRLMWFLQWITSLKGSSGIGKAHLFS